VVVVVSAGVFENSRFVELESWLICLDRNNSWLLSHSLCKSLIRPTWNLIPSLLTFLENTSTWIILAFLLVIYKRIVLFQHDFVCHGITEACFWIPSLAAIVGCAID